MQSQLPTTSESFHLWQTIGASLVGGVLGVLGTLVTFRTRLAVQDGAVRQFGIDMNREHALIKASIANLKDDTEKRHEANQLAYRDALTRVDRKQDAILRIVVAMARKDGTDQRFDDALVRFLSEESRI